MLERRLRELDPDLHRGFTNTVFALQHMLGRFRLLFPEYTDHSQFHCINVLEFCNVLIGPEQLQRLSADEIYVLLMSCYLHDTGMAMTPQDYAAFQDELGCQEYLARWPGRTQADFIRDYHHEFSGRFIRKYAGLLEIPTEEHLFAIVQVSRGHRRTNLYDPAEYPSALALPGGGTVCLPYLSALIRLADEIDVVASRNPPLLYDLESLTDSYQIACNRLLAAVPRMDILPQGFLLHVDLPDPGLRLAVEQMVAKMQATLDLCRSVVAERTPYRITQEWVETIPFQSA